MNITQFFEKILSTKEPQFLDNFYDIASLACIKKGRTLVKAGIFNPNLYFLAEGVLRGFWSDVSGKESTECFIFRSGQPAVGSYRLNKPAAVSIIAETDSLMIQIPKREVINLLSTCPDLLMIYNELLIREIEEQQRIKHAVYMLDAKERYDWFREEYPNLLTLVSLKHIASFLNMSPVTLSRLRRPTGKSHAFLLE